MQSEFNKALKLAFTDLYYFHTPAGWNLIPETYGDLRFPAWFRMALWYQKQLPTLSLRQLAQCVIDGWYDPLALMPPVPLHKKAASNCPIPAPQYYVLWKWLAAQHRFAICNAVVSAGIWKTTTPVKAVLALMVCAHLHDTGKGNLVHGSHDLRVDFEIDLARYPQNSWPRRYPELLQSYVRRVVSFWDDDMLGVQ